MPSPATWKARSPLLKRMREIMQSRRLSPRTEDSYIHYCADFLWWAGIKSTEELTGREAEAYLSHLALDKRVSPSTQNCAFNAILFLFRHVLERDLGTIKAERATCTPNVPEILTKDELTAILARLTGDWKLLTQLGYGTGLRLMELLRLRVRDLDFGNGLITVHDGKGGKNRVVPLPRSLASALKDQICVVTALHKVDVSSGLGSVWLPGQLAAKYPSAPKDPKWQWLFPSREICKDRNGSRRRHHLFPNGFQTALRNAGKSCGITKRVSPHILRHSHATALLEMGRSLGEVQRRLGHKDVTTTMIYLHCVETKAMPSPIDCMCEHA